MSSNTSRTARAAIALKSGVVMGGTAILSAVNGLTPHMAGAIDIMVVQQPDGTLKCSPFYVRFGKYTPMRSKDKKVHILINGEEAAFQMHLGAYGQAYFAAETMEIVSDAEDEELLQGMMSPPSGYSSDEDVPYANEEILSAVQKEVQRIKDKEHQHSMPGSQPADEATAAAAAKAPAGSEALHEILAEDGVGAEVGNTGSESDASISSSMSSSSGLEEMPSTSEITAAIQQGLAAGKGRPSRRSRSRGRAVEGLAADSSLALALGRPSSQVSNSGKQRRRHRRRTRILLDAPGDGAAADPARSNLQDLLLDNRYSIKVKSDESFTADGLGAPVQQLHGKSRLQQEQHQLEGSSSSSSSSLQIEMQQEPQQATDQQQPEPEQQQQAQQQQQVPVRHVGFEVAPNSVPPKGPTAVRKVQAGELAGALDSTASYSIDEVSLPASLVAPGSDGEGSQASSEASVDSPAAAVVSSAVAAVVAANDAAPVAAAATAAAADTSPEAAAATKAVAAANAAVKAQALAAVHESYDAAAAAVAAAEDDNSQSELAAMPTLTDGIAAPTSAGAGIQQQAASPDGVANGLLAGTLMSANVQQQQQQQPEVPGQQEAAAGRTSTSSSSSSNSTAASEPDVVAILESTFPDEASASADHGASFQQQQQQQQQNAVPAPSASSSSNLQPSTPSKPAPQGAAGPADNHTSAASLAVPVPNAAEPSTAAAASGPASLPMTVPGALAASPPVDSGYLGDNEHDKTLGTSYDASTPRGGVAAEHMAAGSGPLALGLAGFQLSLCGGDLRVDMPAGEAQQVFESGRVTAQMWAEKGVSLMDDPSLVVKIGGNLYSWQVAAPMVVGMLAFGGKWDNLLGLDPTGLYPIKVADDHSSTAKKASTSWRLWPFTAWREASGSSKSLPAPGSSPIQPATTPKPAAEKASSGGIAPSGGSFSNLLQLVGPGSKSSPAIAALDAPAAADSSASAASATPAFAVVDGASPRSTAGGASFLSAATSPTRPVSRKKHIIIIRKTLTPTSEQLSRLPLKPGANTITFRAGGAADLTAYIYLLRWNTRLVVSDVDGTITRSDLLGHVLPTLGVDWSHPGITQLFHNIDRNGYQIMFLSSRAIAQANITREYLHTLVQDGYKMPSGPVIISPHGLLPSLYREIVVRRPHEFKIACLQDIRALFPADWNPFYGGFGNRDTDEVSYKMVGVPVSRTFTINPKGQIQKASTALQSSTWSSLSAINDLVEEIFPPLPAVARNTSRVLQHQQSSIYLSFKHTTDWELAAAAGIIGDETLAAAIAEQQRRRSSNSGAGFLPAVAEGPGAGSAEDGDSSNSNAAVGQADAAGNADSKPATAAAGATADIVADGTSTAAVNGALAYNPSYASSNGSARAIWSSVPELQIEDVGPAREEYGDFQYWKSSVTFSVDIEDELKELQKTQQQQKQQVPAAKR